MKSYGRVPAVITCCWWYCLTWTTLLSPSCISSSSTESSLEASNVLKREHRQGIRLLPEEAAILTTTADSTILPGEYPHPPRNLTQRLVSSPGSWQWWSTSQNLPGQQAAHMKSLSRRTWALTNDSGRQPARGSTGSSFVTGRAETNRLELRDLAARLIKPNQLAFPVSFAEKLHSTRLVSPSPSHSPKQKVKEKERKHWAAADAITASRRSSFSVSVLSESEELNVDFAGSDRVPLLATRIPPVHYRKRRAATQESISVSAGQEEFPLSFPKAGNFPTRNGSSSSTGRRATEAVTEMDYGGDGLLLPALDMKQMEKPMAVSPATRAALQTSESVHMQDDEVAFVDALETNVTSSLGETAFLRCRLKGSSQQQVTWVRRRDWHILTSGLLTYTADARFGVKHLPDTHDWTLEIKYLQKKDDGTYECQVPTKTGALVHVFHLFVAAPQAVILGGGVYHVDVTSSVTLVCVIDNAPTPPQVVFWYHNGTLLVDGRYPPTASNSNARGSITTQTTTTASRTMSLLTILDAQDSHTGNYTCTSPNAQPDTTQLFVMRRHEPAAVQRHNSASAAGQYRLEIITAMSFLSTFLRKRCHVLF